MKQTEITTTRARTKESVAVAFSPYGLTYHEQTVLRVLLHATSALNAWEVYRGVLGHLGRFKSLDAEVRDAQDRASFFQKNKLPLASLSTALQVPKGRAEVAAWVKKMKAGKHDIPNFSKVARMLGDMVAAGWVHSRTEGTGRAAALFYIDGEVRERMSEFWEQSFVGRVAGR